MTTKKIIDKIFCIGKDPLDMNAGEWNIWIRKRSRRDKIFGTAFWFSVTVAFVVIVIMFLYRQAK